jgi:hypothetical protein
MIQETKLLGCQAMFALAGKTQVTPTPSGGPVVSNVYIPDNSGADSTSAPIWTPLGIIADAQEKVSSTKIEVYAPSPGTLQLSDVRETKFKRELTLKIGECSNVMWLVLRRALLITSPLTGAIGQFVPLTSGTIKGWIKFQAYNQDTNAQELIEQTWCQFSVDGAVSYGSDKAVEFSASVLQLRSSLNSHQGS